MKKIFAITSLATTAILCAVTLDDLGQSASSGEIPKWNGSQWELAHDDKGVHTVTGSDGVSVDENVGQVSVQVLGQVPIGTVSAWMKSLEGVPQLPGEWVECNGQILNNAGSPLNGATIPDLNGVSGAQRFLRGSTTSGAEGGSESHNHQWMNGGTGAGDRALAIYANVGSSHRSYNSSGEPVTFNNDTALQGNYYTNNQSSLPSYHEVVWIMRIK